MGKISFKQVPGILARKPIWTRTDLLAEGLTQSQIKYLLKNESLVQLAQGILGTPEADAHGRIADVVACLVTGGIICCRTAGARHGLTDDLPSEIEVLIPHGRGRQPVTQAVKLIQSRNSASFTLGIDAETVLGVEVRMTNRARTVVDLVRGPIRQHGVAAVHAFLAEGGTGDELDRMAEPFGVRDHVGLLVEGTLQAMSRPHGP